MPVKPLRETPSQTAGPYLHIGLAPASAGLPVRTQDKPHVLAEASVPGERIVIEGVVYDGSGAPVRDAMVEIWQADSAGRHNGPGFLGWGRAVADFTTGLWRFETIKPGAARGRGGKPEAPHVSFHIFARGINIHLHTRMYFPEEEEANAADRVLRSIEHRHRVPTLIARRETRGGENVYRFDIRLQGEGETIFFDI